MQDKKIFELAEKKFLDLKNIEEIKKNPHSIQCYTSIMECLSNVEEELNIKADQQRDEDFIDYLIEKEILQFNITKKECKDLNSKKILIIAVCYLILAIIIKLQEK